MHHTVRRATHASPLRTNDYWPALRRLAFVWQRDKELPPDLGIVAKRVTAETALLTQRNSYVFHHHLCVVAERKLIRFDLAGLANFGNFPPKRFEFLGDFPSARNFGISALHSEPRCQFLDQFFERAFM